MTSLTSSPAAVSSEKANDVVGDTRSWQNDDTGEDWATTKPELYSFYIYYVGNNGLSGFK